MILREFMKFKKGTYEFFVLVTGLLAFITIVVIGNITIYIFLSTANVPGLNVLIVILSRTEANCRQEGISYGRKGSFLLIFKSVN
jgi:predicted membrane-bound dolichyl-phosphate-mannose-protein mannosyltransferase